MKEIIKNYNENGFEHKGYYVGGKLHRDNGPALIKYYTNGKVDEESYYQNGKLHREDGPAYICYGLNGEIAQMCYYKNGKLHREDGPAWFTYSQVSGKVIVELYFVDGVEYKDILLYSVAVGCFDEQLLVIV